METWSALLESSFAIIMFSEHKDACKVKPRLNAVNLPRQMRSLRFVWRLSHYSIRHDDLERWHPGGMTVMRSSGSASHNDVATPPIQRKTSTVEELHSFPWLLVEWGKASWISCNSDKHHHAHTSPHPPQPFTAVRLKRCFQDSEAIITFAVLFEFQSSILRGG